ncbi:MAG: hypothetical protein LAT55_12635 [Opitutales bacterium]|nr:hypothetical protein [Opitutales bacterium]
MSDKPEIRKIQVKALIDPQQLKKDMSYSLADLSTAMVDQASLFAHYGVLAARASRQVDEMKMLLENAEARVYRRVRDAAAAAGNKLTETQVDKQVAVHPQVIALKKAKNEAAQIEAVAKTAVEAFRHRRDMLVQHGATSREEMKGELSISRRRENETSMKEQRERMLKGLANASTQEEGNE